MCVFTFFLMSYCVNYANLENLLDKQNIKNIIASIEKYGPGYKGMNKARLKKAGNKIYKALQATRGY